MKTKRPTENLKRTKNPVKNSLISSLISALAVMALFASPFLFALAISTFAAAPLTPEEILQKADDVRNPAASYFMQAEVNSGEKLQDQSIFDVSIQGNDKTLVRTIEPSRDHGRNLLMLGEDMWAYLPSVKRPLRVSLSQKLSGQAANGDISRMRWSGDYDAKIEKETRTDWTLFLSARRKGLTYDKARISVNKRDFHPTKAQFLTLSGKPLKEATYGDYKLLAGAVRPALIQIQDSLRPTDRSEIRIRKMEVRSFPASVFNQNSLKD